MRASCHQIVVYPVLHGRFQKGCLAFQLEAAGTDDNGADNVLHFQHCHMSIEVNQSDF